MAVNAIRYELCDGLEWSKRSTQLTISICCRSIQLWIRLLCDNSMRDLAKNVKVGTVSITLIKLIYKSPHLA